MPAADTVNELVRIFDAHSADTGVIGVALGSKEVEGVQPVDGEDAVAFFVERKEPRLGRRSVLPSGRRMVPRTIGLDGSELATDVVETALRTTTATPARLQRARFTAGGPVGNRNEIGTFGCLVTRQGSPFPYVLTNRHVALDPPALVYFPSYGASGAIAAATRVSLQLVPDEQFFPLLDRPRTYFDVDAALVQIPGAKKHLFSPRIPTIGIPDAIFRPDLSGVPAYRRSLEGKPLTSWSWRSKERRGVVSHVFFATRRPAIGTVVYSFLVRSTVPGIPSTENDSGKIWVAKRPGGGVDVVALHVGSTPGDNTRFAVASEMASLARVLRISPRTSI